MKQIPSIPSQKLPALSNAFLVRCWQQEGEWRFILEDVATRERQVFLGMAEMVEQLTAVLDPVGRKNPIFTNLTQDYR